MYLFDLTQKNEGTNTGCMHKGQEQPSYHPKGTKAAQFYQQGLSLCYTSKQCLLTPLVHTPFRCRGLCPLFRFVDGNAEYRATYAGVSGLPIMTPSPTASDANGSRRGSAGVTREGARDRSRGRHVGVTWA